MSQYQAIVRMAFAGWSREAGLSGFHSHDLRDTGNKFAAQSGRDPAGAHEPHGALDYAGRVDLPAHRERDKLIADGMGKLTEEIMKKNEDQEGSGT